MDFNSVIAIVIGGICAIFLIAVNFKALRLWKSRRELEDLALSTEGEITEKKMIWSRAKDAPYLYYKYCPAGSNQTFQGSSKVSRELYGNVKVGDSVFVKYAPENPENSVMQDAVPNFNLIKMAVIMDVFVLLLALLSAAALLTKP